MFDSLLSELWDLSDTELDERIRANELERRRLEAEQVAMVTLAENRQLYAVDGHLTINAYLRATLNCSSTEASRLRTTAKAVDNIDGLGDAWLSGRFGISQVARFAKTYSNKRVRDRLPEAAPLLLANAEQLPFKDFEACVDRFIHNADLDGALDSRDDAVEHRTASVVDVGGMVAISAHGGDPVTSAELIAIFDRFCEAEYQQDLETRRNEHGADADQHPLPRTARQRKFDALATMFRTAAAADNKAGSVADPLVNIVIDAATWIELLASSGLTPDADCGINPELIPTLIDSDILLEDRRCETSTGVQVHPHDVLRAALAGHVRRVAVDSAGVIIDMGRKQRLFTGAARDAAKLLATHCEHPGCELPADWCDVDHQTEWADGGTTDQANSGTNAAPTTPQKPANDGEPNERPTAATTPSDQTEPSSSPSAHDHPCSPTKTPTTTTHPRNRSTRNTRPNPTRRTPRCVKPRSQGWKSVRTESVEWIALPRRSRSARHDLHDSFPPVVAAPRSTRSHLLSRSPSAHHVRFSTFCDRACARRQRRRRPPRRHLPDLRQGELCARRGMSWTPRG